MTSPTATRRADIRMLVITTGAVVMAGALIALIVFTATRNGGVPKPPFSVGYASSIKDNIKSEGPVYYADPSGKGRDFWIALDHGRLAAVAAVAPETKNCVVQWKRIGSTSKNHFGFVDCHGDHLAIAELNEYVVSVPSTGPQKGALLVDIRRIIPPGGTATTPSSTPPSTSSTSSTSSTDAFPTSTTIPT